MNIREWQKARQDGRPVSSDTPLVSDWLVVDQERIDLFGRATNDPDPLHIDPDYARQFSSYGTTISFGFLTMSLLTYFFRSITTEDEEGYALNYGFNKVRLPAVVPVGSRLRGVFRLKSVEDRGGGKLLSTYDAVIEIEGEERPALVAEWLAMWVADGVHRPAA
jgi:acyl dehydratase